MQNLSKLQVFKIVADETFMNVKLGKEDTISVFFACTF